jgi:hypothetical protein
MELISALKSLPAQRQLHSLFQFETRISKIRSAIERSMVQNMGPTQPFACLYGVSRYKCPKSWCVAFCMGFHHIAIFMSMLCSMNVRFVVPRKVAHHSGLGSQQKRISISITADSIVVVP